MGSSLHYFSYCYPLPVIDTFSGIMLAQQILLGATHICHNPLSWFESIFHFRLFASIVDPFQVRSLRPFQLPPKGRD